jgi:hypothetical protein
MSNIAMVQAKIVNQEVNPDIEQIKRALEDAREKVSEINAAITALESQVENAVGIDGAVQYAKDGKLANDGYITYTEANKTLELDSGQIKVSDNGAATLSLLANDNKARIRTMDSSTDIRFQVNVNQQVMKMTTGQDVYIGTSAGATAGARLDVDGGVVIRSIATKLSHPTGWKPVNIDTTTGELYIQSP